MDKEALIEELNAGSRKERMAAARELKKLADAGGIAVPVHEGYTNNHVHTKYSFSPYSPAKAVWAAYMSGLDTVGIVDHDSLGGAKEFIEAGSILGMATTVGFEMRTDWSGTKLNGKRINNPDQLSNAYICAHGVPHTRIDTADAFLNTIRTARAKRNRAMTERLNSIMSRIGLSIDYDADVLPLSYTPEGEVTERHLLFALALKMTERLGKGQEIIDFISTEMNITLSEKQRAYLEDTGSGIYEYDLLNILKSSFISSIYIDTGREETPPVCEAVAFIKMTGAIPTYCYLGDVKASPTGDKKEQKFEDDYLEELFDECRAIGFDAVAFMPSRNTEEQLERVMSLCGEYGFMQISGEDVNQPRQSFVCGQLKDKRYAHLADAAWALIGHEISASKDVNNGMFAGGKAFTPAAMRERIEKYKRIGLRRQAEV